MKRLYRRVATEPAAGGHAVTLDGKRMRTPGRRELVLPNAALAAAIAAEWEAQRGDIRPATMPLTRLAATALDHTAVQRAAIVGDTAGYAGTDLLCYRADRPPALAARQQEVWQPLVEWAEQRFDVRFAIVVGLIPRPQSPATLAAFAAAVTAHDDFRLTALHAATAACGSLVLALALAEGRIDAAAAFAAAQLDESFQIEAWGEDADAAARRRAIAADIAAIARFIALLDD